MRQACLLLLPWLPFLCGCHALARNVEVIKHHPGDVPETTVAKYNASFNLFAPENLATWAGTDVSKGEAVGFRREPDGSVIAFAGSQTWPVEPSKGPLVWLCTPKPVTGWDRFIVRARDKTEHACFTTLFILTAPIWIPQCEKTGVWP